MNPLAWQNAYDVLHCNNNFNSLAERLFLYKLSVTTTTMMTVGRMEHFVNSRCVLNTIMAV